MLISDFLLLFLFLLLLSPHGELSEECLSEDNPLTSVSPYIMCLFITSIKSYSHQAARFISISTPYPLPCNSFCHLEADHIAWVCPPRSVRTKWNHFNPLLPLASWKRLHFLFPSPSSTLPWRALYLLSPTPVSNWFYDLKAARCALLYLFIGWMVGWLWF